MYKRYETEEGSKKEKEKEKMCSPSAMWQELEQSMCLPSATWQKLDKRVIC